MSPSLPELYTRILNNASKVSGLNTIDNETQELISECLSDLSTLHARLIEFSIFSPNETLDDISTRDLVYLTVPYVFSEMQNRVGTPERTDRLTSLIQAENYLRKFAILVEKYGIVPEDEQHLYGRIAVDIADFSKRREVKINQYKKEKDLKARIEKLQKRFGKKPAMDRAPTDYDVILSLLPASQTKSSDGAEELDSETDEVLRETTLILLRLFFAQASSQLQSLGQEKQLLNTVPPRSEATDSAMSDPRSKKRKEEEDAWKLDLQLGGGPDGRGPILDASGKPLRPFTILPSEAGERARVQAKVFGPGYNLPTMTIDEYLEIERQRGNIITGGGPASQSIPTSSEQLAIDSEMDGTLYGELKQEEKRLKDEKWAGYTDDHPRGAGNRMNRG